MATSSLSSLGLGSSGVLSYDTIDKLRAADESAVLTPIDNKLTTNTSKKSDLTVLSKLTTSLESVTKSLSDELSYLKRSATVSNSAVSISTVSGSTIQDFSLHVNALAQRDIYQSAGFESATSTFAGSTTTAAGTVVAPTTSTTNGSASVTESSTVTFNAANMSDGDTLTIGGLTLTATGTITQAEAIAAFANLSSGATSGNTVNNGTWSGTLSDFNSGAASGSTLTFTSTTANSDVTDLATSVTQAAAVTTTVPDSYTLSMRIGDATYSLDMTSGTTLSQLKDMIND
ncbi:MAG: flagellar cap protein FliD N-terminal domain-containing protein, partial [Sulfurospirillaceae bacterium]|nr:flagellar cap protein FliD N-terminal domain-containing protein [Sulfurospirillaceae bacterium]